MRTEEIALIFRTWFSRFLAANTKVMQFTWLLVSAYLDRCCTRRIAKVYLVPGRLP